MPGNHFFLGRATEKNSHQIFSQVGTWFVSIALLVMLSITMFINEIIQFKLFGYTFLGIGYWDSTTIVPVILMAYIFLGIFTIQLAGIYIHKKTKWIPIIIGASAIVNIVSNIILIQFYGWEGAAWATLIGYIFMAILQFFIVKRFYQLFWEWIKLIRVIILFILLLSIWKFTSFGDMFFIKTFMIILFAFGAYYFVSNKNQLID